MGKLSLSYVYKWQSSWYQQHFNIVSNEHYCLGCWMLNSSIRLDKFNINIRTSCNDNTEIDTKIVLYNAILTTFKTYCFLLGRVGFLTPFCWFPCFDVRAFGWWLGSRYDWLGLMWGFYLLNSITSCVSTQFIIFLKGV